MKILVENLREKLGRKCIFKPVTRNDRFKCQYNDNDDTVVNLATTKKCNCQEHNILAQKCLQIHKVGPLLTERLKDRLMIL
jgi:hypothetical protein